MRMIFLAAAGVVMPLGKAAVHAHVNLSQQQQLLVDMIAVVDNEASGLSNTYE